MQQTSALMLRAAQAFLAALSPEQRVAATFPFDDEERYTWAFFPIPRRGVALKDLPAAQRQLADALIASGYSPAGAVTAHTIMSLDEVLLVEERDRAERTLRSLGANRNMAVGELLLREGYEAVWRHIRNPDLYYLTIFGEPSAGATWGWRLDGHHVCLNVTLPQGRLGSTTPSFLGANPAEVRSGLRAGLRALAAEEDLARDLLAVLDGSERNAAIVDAEAPADILTFNHRRAEPLGEAGIAASDLRPSARDRLRALVEAYAAPMPEEVAAARIAAFHATAPGDLRFAWLGSTNPGEGHYYRIQTPAFVIEYDNTQDKANHIHTVWREFQGDWGADLLGEHLTVAHGVAG